MGSCISVATKAPNNLVGTWDFEEGDTKKKVTIKADGNVEWSYEVKSGGSTTSENGTLPMAGWSEKGGSTIEGFVCCITKTMVVEPVAEHELMIDGTTFTRA